MIIITAVGKDRPGMAHAVASQLAELGCNIEDTTMTRLSGEFAMILIVTPPVGTSPEQVAAALAPVESSHGLFISCRDIDDQSALEDSGLPRFMLSVYGPERTGLVAHITGVLARHGANITDVQTRVASGGAVYVMLYEIELPDVAAYDSLKADLEQSAPQIGAQVSLRAIEEETL